MFHWKWKSHTIAKVSDNSESLKVFLNDCLLMVYIPTVTMTIPLSQWPSYVLASALDNGS